MEYLLQSSAGMKRTLRQWLAQYRCMDWAVLYLRLFIGGILLLHNIGKMQQYDQIINSYPALPGMNSAATFVAICVAEVLFAVLLMLGLWVRFSAAVMSAGMLISILFLFPSAGFLAAELQFVYMGIYVFLLISGAGAYSFDAALFAKKPSKPNE